MRRFMSAPPSSSDDFSPLRRRLWATVAAFLGLLFLAQVTTIVIVIRSIGS